MKTVIISPYSKQMRNGQKNPKNFPHWAVLVEKLWMRGIRVVQVGAPGEEKIAGVHDFKFGLKLSELKAMLEKSETWVSVDNFFNHFATFHGRRGVAIFSRSDPRIFGYDQNINLLKDRSYLRPNQFEMWEQDTFREDAFVSADAVLDAIVTILSEEKQ